MTEDELSALGELIKLGDRTADDERVQLADDLGDVGELRRLADLGNRTANDQLEELEEG